MATERYIKTIELLTYCLKENVTLREACVYFGLGEGFPRRSRTRLADATASGRITMDEWIAYKSLDNQIIDRKSLTPNKSNMSNKTLTNTVDLDNDERFDERSKGWEVRDDKGLITSYAYKILVRDELPFTGSLTRNQMEKICSEYPYTTLNNVSIDFPYLTLQDLKRIMRTFNITKDRLFPPHILEEHTESEIANFALKAKEKSSFKRFSAQKLPFIENKLRETQEELKKATESQEWADKIIEKYFNKQSIKPAYINKTETSNVLGKTTFSVFADLHFGKLFPTKKIMFGRGSDKNIIRERCLKIAELTCKEAIANESKKIALLCMGDIFESIQPSGQRPQHTDSMDIVGDEQFMFALDVFEEMIEIIISRCGDKEIELHGIGGNHDRLMDNSKFDKKRTAAQLFYRLLKKMLSLKHGASVNVVTYEDGIMSFADGRTSIIGQHGDAILAKRTPLEIMNLFKSGSAKNYTVLLRAHLHNLKMDWEYPNCISIQVRSVCSSDEFSQNELGKGAQPGFTVFNESEHYGVDIKNYTLY